MIVVWKKPNGDYYYRFVNGFYCSYNIGYKNQYDHVVILTINHKDLFPKYYKISFRKKLISKLITFLKKYAY